MNPEIRTRISRFLFMSKLSKQDKIDIYNNSPKTEDKIKNIIPTILESIAEKVHITIDYKTVNEEIKISFLNRKSCR